jgi:GH15 family glucan-1,4-alpha-glucosidase
MRQLIQLLLRNSSYLLVVLFLYGCAISPVQLGIAPTEWSTYSLEQQQKILDDSAKYFKYHARISKRKANAKGECLEIAIHSGQVMLPPFSNWSDYKPAHFTIFKGQCRDIVLEQAAEEVSTELGVCYYGNVLYLDPSHYDLKLYKGSVSIHSSPLWLSGFSYKGISSGGYVRLKNVTIRVKQKPMNCRGEDSNLHGDIPTSI